MEREISLSKEFPGVTPDQEMRLVEFDDEGYFGAVLYSRHLLNVNWYTVIGQDAS